MWTSVHGGKSKTKGGLGNGANDDGAHAADALRTSNNGREGEKSRSEVRELTNRLRDRTSISGVSISLFTAHHPIDLMVRVQKVHHQPPRGCLSPLDALRLRIKSPRFSELIDAQCRPMNDCGFVPGNNATRRSEHSKARNSTRNGEGYGNSPFNHQPKHDLSYFGLNDKTLQDEASSESEDELFQWEEEETLVNALINDG